MEIISIMFEIVLTKKQRNLRNGIFVRWKILFQLWSLLFLALLELKVLIACSFPMMTFADDSEKQGNIPRSQEEVINWLPISSTDSKVDISFFRKSPEKCCRILCRLTVSKNNSSNGHNLFVSTVSKSELTRLKVNSVLRPLRMLL